MTSGQATKIATLSIGTTVALTVGHSLLVEEKFPPVTYWLATGAFAFGISAASDIEPRIAAPLGILIATVVLFDFGPDLFRKINGGMDARTKRLARQLTNRRSIR